VTIALILPPTAASFQTIGGLPLIQRTVLGSLRAGFERVLVMAGSEGPRLRDLFAGDARTRGVAVLEGRPVDALCEGQVAVIPGDSLVTPAALARVRGAPALGRCMIFEGNGTRLTLGPAERLAELMGDGGALLGPDASVASLDGDVCVHVTDEASARAAEARLLAEIRASTAASDGPLARLIDRSVSQWISRRLVHTRLRPNHITIISTAIGLAGAWCLARGAWAFDVLGTLLFLCATVIDGCDGEVARLKFQETPFGKSFDVATDNVVHAAIFIGLAFGQYQRDPDGRYGVLLGVLLGGVAAAATAGWWCLLHPVAMRRTVRTMKGKIRNALLRTFESVLNRDFAYLLFALAVIDRLQWFFWGAAFGAWVFAAALVWVYRWRDAG
jgi:phosphatidylglycerophosphate synthase